MKFKLVIGILLITLLVGAVYFDKIQNDRMDKMILEVANESLFPELDEITDEGLTKINGYKDSNIISDIENDDFHAVSKMYSFDNRKLVWIKVELFKSDKKYNIEIINGICENMMGLAEQEISTLMIDFNIDEVSIVSFTYDLTKIDAEPIIIWSNEEYKSYYN